MCRLALSQSNSIKIHCLVDIVISSKEIFRVELTNQIDSLAVIKCIHTLRNLKLCSVQVRKKTENYNYSNIQVISHKATFISFAVHVYFSHLFQL